MQTKLETTLILSRLVHSYDAIVQFVTSRTMRLLEKVDHTSTFFGHQEIRQMCFLLIENMPTYTIKHKNLSVCQKLVNEYQPLHRKSTSERLKVEFFTVLP